MSEQTFDAITRRAAEAVSRRSSLAALGGAAVAAAVLAPSTFAAKDNKAKKAKKKARKKCKRQQGQCEAAVRAFCAAINAPAAESVSAEGLPTCEEFFSVCCPPFASCDAQQGVACLLSRSLPQDM